MTISNMWHVRDRSFQQEGILVHNATDGCYLFIIGGRRTEVPAVKDLPKYQEADLLTEFLPLNNAARALMKSLLTASWAPKSDTLPLIPELETGTI